MCLSLWRAVKWLRLFPPTQGTDSLRNVPRHVCSVPPVKGTDVAHVAKVRSAAAMGVPPEKGTDVLRAIRLRLSCHPNTSVYARAVPPELGTDSLR